MSINIVKVTHPKSFGFVIGDLVKSKTDCVFLRGTEHNNAIQKFLRVLHVMNTNAKDLKFLKANLSKDEEFMILDCIEVAYTDALVNAQIIKTKVDKVITLFHIRTSSKLDFYLNNAYSNIDNVFEKVNEDL